MGKFGQTLYELSAEFAAVSRMLEEAADDSGEIPSNIAERLDAVQGSFADKVDSVLRLRAELVSRAVGIEDEVKRLTALRDGYHRRAEWLKEYVRQSMETTGQKKLDTAIFKVWIQKNGRPSVSLREGEEIPDEFKRVTYSFDSQAAYDRWKKLKQLEEALEQTYGVKETSAILEEIDRLKLPDSIEVREGNHLRIK